MTTIELKEQIKLLREQQKQVEKIMNKKKKLYDTWETMLRQHPSFCYVNNWKNKYSSFEALIIDQDFKNTRMEKTEFEFLFNELGFTDTEFFTKFMNWDKIMFDIPIEDRKCSVCISYYNSTKLQKKFMNCCHKVCNECYTQIIKKDGYRCCVICRQSERPKSNIFGNVPVYHDITEFEDGYLS